MEQRLRSVGSLIYVTAGTDALLDTLSILCPRRPCPERPDQFVRSGFDQSLGLYDQKEMPEGAADE